MEEAGTVAMPEAEMAEDLGSSTESQAQTTAATPATTTTTTIATAEATILPPLPTVGPVWQ